MHKLINQLLEGLPARERDVLVGRYGLEGSPELTLAELGTKYGITRERVRQIEAFSLAAARKRMAAPEALAFVAFAAGELQRAGGVMRDDRLITALVKAAKEKASSDTFAPAARFVLELSGKIRERREDAHFHRYWHLGGDYDKRARDFVRKATAAARSRRNAMIAENSVFTTAVTAAAKPFRLNDAAAEHALAISKQFMRGPLGDFGLAEWPEVNPKTARDWAYLVVKRVGKPMHFTELVAHINRYRKNKITNVQTVHNELIKDERFVLVGRGTYGLREFGILPGTAREVIAHFLKNNGPLPAREIVRLVLGERIFKEGTILISLQNRDYFKRLGDGRYTLA